MNKGEYNEKLSYLLKDQNTYIKLDKDPTNKYKEIGNYTIKLTITDNFENIASDTTWAIYPEYLLTSNLLDGWLG